MEMTTEDWYTVFEAVAIYRDAMRTADRDDNEYAHEWRMYDETEPAFKEVRYLGHPRIYMCWLGRTWHHDRSNIFGFPIYRRYPLRAEYARLDE